MRVLEDEDIKRARSIVNHLALRHRDLREDIESAAYEGLCLAARDWKMGGMSWSYYSYVRIMGTAIDYLRSLSPDLKAFKEYAQAHGGEARPWPPAREYLKDDLFWSAVKSEARSHEDVLIDLDARRWLRARLAADQELLEWFDGAYLKDIAARRGVHESRICQITTKAIARALSELRP